jgi:microcin C transport system substrate-binding protein
VRNRALTAVLLAAAALVAVPAQAQKPAPAAQPAAQKRLHALALLGEPKYKPGFKQLEYVNPNAPKGGRARLPAVGTFDTLNPILYKGNHAAGLGFLLDPLMEASLDEPATAYCHICEWVSHPDDFSSVTFKLRQGARFHDGKPITVEDVIFSLESLKKANPRYSLYYKHVSGAAETAPGEVTFTFDMKGNRELPQIVGELNILPKHWWTAKDATGRQRSVLETTLEPPLGSGPYRIKEAVPGRSISYERVADYWAKDLPHLIGHNNFAELRFEYFKDTTPALEAFKAGQVDFFRESSAKNWATQYDFQAVRDAQVRKREIKLRRVQGMQAFVFNTRREKFADPRVRQAFNLAYDFDWANANLFFGQYTRLASYFDNSELASRGLPQGLELEILNTVKSEVPPQVFTQEYKNPAWGKPESLRANLGLAAKLLDEAGWQVKDGVRTNAKGQQLTAEFLLSTAGTAFERIVLPYIQNLERIGIKAQLRVVDVPQYKQRTDNFDFDAAIESFGQSESPGNEQRDYWGSAAASQPGSRNLIGVKSAGVDKLIDRIVAAKDRDELVAATRALDRVLLWSHYVVPNWYIAHERAAHWDYFGEPAVLPSRTDGFPTVWWWDEAKAKVTQARR